MDEKLISIEHVVEKAKAIGIEFGKGDPYNRLRYYTKIGWLPHMQRKIGEAEDSNVTTGHYPKWVIKRLLQIEQLKKSGLTNEEISKKLEISNKVQAITDFIKAPQTRLKLATYLSLVLLLFILAIELDIIKLGKSKNSFILPNAPIQTVQVVDSGEGQFPATLQKLFVSTKGVNLSSKIAVTFRQDYSPAARYWISKIMPEEGFEISVDAPLANTAHFDWLITN